MRNTRLRGAAVVVSVVAVLAGAGCGDDETTEDSASCPTKAQPGLAIALGDRANSPAPRLPELVASYLNDIPTGQGFTIVRVDGEPSIACADVFASTSVAKAALADERLEFGQYAVDQMNAARATKAEANPLSALGLAASAAGPDGTVVLVDSGLQTKAPLDFRGEGTLFLPPSEIVRQLRADDQLPDLTRRRVVLSGIGYTAPPQKRLDPGIQRHLVDIWKEIVKAAGATTVEVLGQPSTDPAVDGVPKVSTVRIPDPDPVTAACGSEIELPDGGAVGFRPDEAVYREPARAKATLLTVADFLQQNRSADVAATGTIAHYGPDVPDAGLAMERAEAVAGTLVDLGAGASQVTPHGGGWGPYQGSGDDVDQRNRRVVLRIRC